MDGIIVDTCGESDLLNKDQLVESDDEDDDSDFEDTGEYLQFENFKVII